MNQDWVSPSRKKKSKLSNEFGGSSSSMGSANFAMPLTERQQLAYLMAMTKGESGEDITETKKIKKARFTPTSNINKAVNKSGETQLHLSAMKGEVEGTKNLIKQGADVNCKDYAGELSFLTIIIIFVIFILCRHNKSKNAKLIKQLKLQIGSIRKSRMNVNPI